MKKFTILLLALMLAMSFGIVSFAQGTIVKQDSTLSTKSITAPTTVGGVPTVNNIADGDLPIVTINDASAWAERKGFEVVGFLQTIVQPFAVIIFIICALMTLVGAFGNSQLVGRGIFGMFLSVVIYAVVIYAPEIMDFLLNWLKA